MDSELKGKIVAVAKAKMRKDNAETYQRQCLITGRHLPEARMEYERASDELDMLLTFMLIRFSLVEEVEEITSGEYGLPAKVGVAS